MELIRTEMTPKERVKAYSRGETVDRLPTSLSANETAPPMYGYRISDYYFSSDIMVDVESRLAEDFGADNMGIGLGLRTVVEALGTELAYPEDSVSYIVKPRLDSFDQVSELGLLDIDRDGRLPIIVNAFERLMDRYGNERVFGSGLAGPFTTAASLIGTEKFLIGTARNKEGVHKLLQYCTDCIVELCRDLNQRLGIGFMLSEPMGSKNLISVRQFREFFTPYISQAVARMNEFQGSTGIHICGNTRDRWQDVIDTGVSGFWIDNCENLAELKELYGDKVSVTGNVPPVDVLKNGTPDQIEASVRKCILDAADNPLGYRLSPGCTTPVFTSRDNMICFMNAATRYGKMARRGQLPEGVLEFKAKHGV
jgi:uroporphyrinogen decarboxylase